MSKILSFLDSFRLTLAQWASLSAVAIIGGLIAALKLEGSRVHRLQVQLLETQSQQQLDQAKAATQTALDRYTAARQAYLKAGGVLLLILCLGLTPPARGGQVDPLLPKCQSALSACDALVNAQQSQIAILNKQVDQWKKEAEKDQPSLIQSESWILWVVLGGLAGFGAARLVK